MYNSLLKHKLPFSYGDLMRSWPAFKILVSLSDLVSSFSSACYLILPFGFRISLSTLPLIPRPGIRKGSHICYLLLREVLGRSEFFLLLPVSSGADTFCDIGCDRAHCAAQRFQYFMGIWEDKWGHGSFPHKAHNLLMEINHRQWLKNWLNKYHGAWEHRKIAFLSCHPY